MRFNLEKLGSRVFRTLRAK